MIVQQLVVILVFSQDGVIAHPSTLPSWFLCWGTLDLSFNSFVSHKFIYLFIFGCVGSLLLQAGFSLVVASGGYSSLQCTGFSWWWLLLLWSTGLGVQALVVSARGLSSCGSQALEHRLSSCGLLA